MEGGASGTIRNLIYLMIPPSIGRTGHWDFPRTAQELTFQKRLSFSLLLLKLTPSIHKNFQSCPSPSFLNYYAQEPSFRFLEILTTRNLTPEILAPVWDLAISSAPLTGLVLGFANTHNCFQLPALTCPTTFAKVGVLYRPTSGSVLSLQLTVDMLSSLSWRRCWLHTSSPSPTVLVFATVPWLDHLRSLPSFVPNVHRLLRLQGSLSLQPTNLPTLQHELIKEFFNQLIIGASPLL